jgi:hypothetical protein
MVVYNDRTTICFVSFRLEEKLDAILAYIDRFRLFISDIQLF